MAPELIGSAIELAAQAMSWPDLQTNLRAVAVCRTVAAAAGAPLNPVTTTNAPAPAAAVRPLLVTVLLPAALQAMSVASAPNAWSEQILLIRSIWISCASQSPSPADVIRNALPSVTVEQIQQVRSGCIRNRSPDLSNLMFFSSNIHNNTIEIFRFYRGPNSIMATLR